MRLLVYFPSFLLGIVLFYREADGIFMWTAPLLAWNQTNGGSDPADIQTAVIQVLNGSTNVIVRWNYTLLPGQSIYLTTFIIKNGINSQDTVGIVTGRRSKIDNRNGYQTRFSIDSSNEFSTLRINAVTERENATFQCKIDSADTYWTYNIKIEVTVPPKITYLSEDRTVNKGDMVLLQCTADGYPAPNITWTRLSDNNVVTFPLTIAGKQDEGIYRCTANNGFGTVAIRDVTIALPSPPEITKPKTVTRTAIAGESVYVSCHANGSPSPQYVWRNAAGEVVTTEEHLRLHNVNESHGGNYTCTATNSQGSASFSILVTITSTSSRKPSASSPSTRATPENKARTTSSDDSAWIIMGAAVGGTLVLVVIVALVVWWMRRDTTTGKEEKEDEHLREGAGYQNIPHYAVVVKSQNGKKKRRPGEVLYADLENFSRQEMPTVTTSENPLPPIKRPTPYVKTDYAEITHFMKADVSGVQAPGANANSGWDENRETIM